MLLEEENDLNKIRLLNKIDKNLKRTIELIENTTNLSRLENTKEIGFEDINLNLVFNDIIEEFKPSIEKSGIEIVKRFEKDIFVRSNSTIKEVFPI